MSVSAVATSHELIFTRDPHGFTLDGKPVPGATTVAHTLDAPALDDWRARTGWEAAQAIRVTTAAFGTSVHVALAIRERGEQLLPFEMSPSWKACVDKAMAWVDANVAEVLYVEEPVASVRYGFAGVPDLIARLNGHTRPTIVDWKTGDEIYDQAALQLALYRIAVREWLGLTCDTIAIPLDRDHPDKPLKPVRFRVHAQNEAAALCCLNLYRWTKGGPR